MIVYGQCCEAMFSGARLCWWTNGEFPICCVYDDLVIVVDVVISISSS